MARLFVALMLAATLALAWADAAQARPGGLPAGGPLAVSALDSAAVLAQAAFTRGTGFYVSWPKILACWLLFILWVHTTNWVSTDGQEMHLQHVRWNPIVFGVFMGFFVLAWLLPWFWLGFPLLVVAYIVPLTTYVIYRNQNVPLDQCVLTPAHLRYWFGTRLNKLGMNVEVEKKAEWEIGPPVKLDAVGAASDRDDRAHLLAARQSAGFNESRGLLATALSRRATALMLEYTQEQVGVRYMIDGVWHNDEPRDRETCDPVLESLKTLSGLNPQERQAKQNGLFLVNYDNIDYQTSITSQGTSTGERVVLQLEEKKVHFKTLDDLGMRPKMQEQILEILNRKEGFVILSAMPASGLRSTTNVVLQKTDRFTREFMALEDEANPYEKVENVPVTTFQQGENAPEDKRLDKVMIKMFRMEPDVIVMRDLVNATAVNMLCEEQQNDHRLIVGTVRAKDCIEALFRVLALKAPPKTFARSITAVLNQRLIRRLCDSCKEAYAPTPQVLQQLGIPPGRVQAFCRPPQEPQEVCPACNGIGYRGRTAIFELLVVDDGVRKALASGAKMEEVRLAARKAGMQSLQAEGVVLVAKGVTSLPELMRVMKQ
ncbi:MAG: Flp pilus assembly complex ATPase component TadA [Pirellulales bacterium]|nr:Flp pilus assembly complex ATPase component TadA [Pirellulales bacterium]